MSRNLRRALDDLLRTPELTESVVLDHAFPAREARTAPFPSGLAEPLRRGLARGGICELYTHQAEALAHIGAGRDVVLATPTASGKSLCYQLPLLRELQRNPEARAMLVFPTKALGQDQVTALLELSERCDLSVKVHTFDGDTPSDVRNVVRREAQVVVTNPDMLHQGILPHHPTWMSFFRSLRFVVLDELHTYRGVFGSHVAHVVHRMHRVCSFYGSRPQIIAGSATIANPGELFEGLVGRSCELVDDPGSPTGERRLMVACPPLVNRALGIRQSYVLFARKLLQPFLEHKVATIVFGLSRLNVEVLLKYVRDDLKGFRLNPGLAQGYRGGYLPKTRRAIERGLRDGSVCFVVSTSALELGIDIGSLEACFVVGYPGTVASFWQQAGRAGRRDGPAAVVYVPRSNPLDQYVAHEPGWLLGSEPEHARIDPGNLVIASEHLKCAAYELPFDDGEPYGGFDGADTHELLDTLSGYRVLHHAGGRYHWSDRTFPANQVSLRSVPGDNFVVIDLDRDRLIAEVDFKSAHTTLHEGAIYNLQGVQHEVLRLDYDGHKAYVRRVKPDYFTEAMTYVEVEPLETCEALRPTSVVYEQGDVKVTEIVIGYKKIRFHTNENVGYGEVDLPEITLHTHGAWAILPGALLHEVATAVCTRSAAKGRPLGPADVALDALTGLSRALHHVATLRLMCDPRDLGQCVGDRTERWFEKVGQSGLSTRVKARMDPFAFDPTLFLYDTYPGGIGLCERAATDLPILLANAGALIARCPCWGGCPSCVGALADPSPAVKEVASGLLDALLASPAHERTSTWV